jgi:Tfp pilus assembly protein PilE
MAQLKSNQVKASTLLEVIIAMVIILVVFVIATGIYTNVIRSSPSVKAQQAKALAVSLIEESISEKDWTDKSIEKDSIRLNKTVIPYEGYADLLLITVTATEHGKTVGQSKQIIKKPEDE